VAVDLVGERFIVPSVPAVDAFETSDVRHDVDLGRP
jgi:hypothetical protein